jgi:orotidine-5'-phosphate decarboxylase
MTGGKERLIVALDVPGADQARALVDELAGDVEIFKVGSQIFTAAGPEIVRRIHSRGRRVFLDLKFHDIPNTVGCAVAAATALGEKDSPLFMCTLHTQGGLEMMKAAVARSAETARVIGVKRPLLVGITVLTSDAKTDNIHAIIRQRARLAQEAGLDGVVASSQEAAFLRKEFGRDFIIVTPGIRPAGAEAGDQKRVATPGEAVRNGSDYLVVGRPIVEAPDPVKAARAILNEIEQALHTQG